MKKLLTIFLIMTTMAVTAQDGKARTIKKTFSRSTEVNIDINADQETVWRLLTDASNFPNWNSTVLGIEGDIKVGEKIKLKSYLDPSRTFKIKVKAMAPSERMVWGDGMGERVYTIKKSANGVNFNMYEKIGNFMFPLFANKIPDFDESFEKYAADLKQEAEKLAKGK